MTSRNTLTLKLEIHNYVYRMKSLCRDMTTRRTYLQHGPAGPDKISLVVYIDYEREFGSHNAMPTAQKGYEAVKGILKKYGIKTTWNCVGLVAEKYPETINQLLADEHEIASHTHSHIVPLNTDAKSLHRDLIQSKKLFKDRFGVELEGFHSPQDGWSRQLFNILLSLDFKYDIAREKNIQSCHASYLLTNKSPASKVLRIPSIFDDWTFIENEKISDSVLSGWLENLSQVDKGKTVAIGFHPWVLGQTERRIQMVDSLLGHIIQDKQICIYRGCDIAAWYRQ